MFRKNSIGNPIDTDILMYFDDDKVAHVHCSYIHHSNQNAEIRGIPRFFVDLEKNFQELSFTLIFQFR